MFSPIRNELNLQNLTSTMQTYKSVVALTERRAASIIGLALINIIAEKSITAKSCGVCRLLTYSQQSVIILPYINSKNIATEEEVWAPETDIGM